MTLALKGDMRDGCQGQEGTRWDGSVQEALRRGRRGVGRGRAEPRPPRPRASHCGGKDTLSPFPDADRQQVFHAQLALQDVTERASYFRGKKGGREKGRGGFFHMVKVLIKINCKLC